MANFLLLQLFYQKIVEDLHHMHQLKWKHFLKVVLITNLSTRQINQLPEWIKNHILQRFIPGENYQTAFKLFVHKLDTNSNTFSEDIIDFLK